MSFLDSTDGGIPLSATGPWHAEAASERHRSRGFEIAGRHEVWTLGAAARLTATAASAWGMDRARGESHDDAGR